MKTSGRQLPAVIDSPVMPAAIAQDRKLMKSWLKLQKRAQDRADLQRAVQFIQDNPWVQVLGGLVLVDLLRYLGIISKSKSSDMAVLITFLGVNMNGGSITGAAITAAIGGALEFFPDTPISSPGAPPFMPTNPGTPGKFFPPADPGAPINV